MIPLVLGCKQVVLVGDHQVGILRFITIENSQRPTATWTGDYEQESRTGWFDSVAVREIGCAREPTHPSPSTISDASLLIRLPFQYVL